MRKYRKAKFTNQNASKRRLTGTCVLQHKIDHERNLVVGLFAAIRKFVFFLLIGYEFSFIQYPDQRFVRIEYKNRI